MRILIPDTWHFHRRNFAALYDAAKACGARLWVEKSRRRWWKRHGDYRSFAAVLRPHLDVLAGMGPEALARVEHRGVRLFAVARAEFLCLVLPRWTEGAGPNTDDNVLARAWADARDDLLLCLAAARDWIEFWHRVLASRGPFSHALVFSGSYIYTRALQEVASLAGVRMFALESFFTGNDFYFEERARPLSNNSLLGDRAWMARLALPTDVDVLARVRADAHRRFAAMRNKNVRADASALVPPPFADRGGGTLLLIGQVLNDFSLIETGLPELSSPRVYRDLIAGILEHTNLTVIFKAHPWERRRPNVLGPATLDALARWSASLPADRRDRLRLVEVEPITGLFPHCDWVAALCSQGQLEAAQAGLKPIQLGRAFYGGHGFSHDYADVGALVADLAAGRVAGRLTLAEYRAFEDFMVRALVLHLVPNSREGVGKVVRRLAEVHHLATLDEAELFPSARRSAWTTLRRAVANPTALVRLVANRLSRHG